MTRWFDAAGAPAMIVTHPFDSLDLLLGAAVGVRRIIVVRVL